MKYTAFVLVIPLLIIWVVLNAYAEPNKAKAELNNSKGENIGIATLVEGIDGVLITINVWNLPPGLHGFHIHEAGKSNRYSC